MEILMRKFISKCLLLFCIFIFYGLFVIHFDTFNIFHWNNIRFTSAEPNKNYVKTKFVNNNPERFNAFVMGSSRVGNIPCDYLPEKLNDKDLYWYNMTYSEGIPSEHLLTLKSFLNNGVSIDMIILGFDNIAMYAKIDDHNCQLLRIPYQSYEDNPLYFYKTYLHILPAFSIIKEVFKYKTSEHLEDTKFFYEYGVLKANTSFSTSSEPVIFPSAHGNKTYSQTESYKDIESICQICKENGIKLILFTNPIYMTTYIDSVENGYFNFLRKVSRNCEFYNFSTLNTFSMDSRYYFEGSHYRPALGLIVEKVLFGTEEETNEIRNEAQDELFGIKVNSDNIDFVISELEKQLQEYKKNNSKL